MDKYDIVIIGAGIIGLSIAFELKKRDSSLALAILEKESQVAQHSSGRNSGVLHAGFYYTADSLKARFTRDGNTEMTNYCLDRGIKINRCGKLVVATSVEEIQGLEELKRRADRNGVNLLWVDEREAAQIEPNIRTVEKALYSPTTSSVDPMEVCQKLKETLIQMRVDIFFNTPYTGYKNGLVMAGELKIKADYIINAAGLYADKIAHDFNFGKKYTIIPFKGVYLKYTKNKTDIRTNIYPVPNLANPFLGVHFTKTVDGNIKIGPTAIPAFWRENYLGMQNFNIGEFLLVAGYEMKLFITNSFNFRSLASNEMKKYNRRHFIQLAEKMVRHLDKDGFGDYLRPGIRAQLLNKESLELVQDFIIEGDNRTLHILNAVSPAFTCAFPFARFVIDKMIELKRN
ncbi:fad dependent oxidoreductase [Heliomicrobium modesticaldum Ice1]|uniref:Fad dependent oxidoreductase n=1 Tax=Heliobacterium modesticaldum (strain ATCC 51547 / Ice1) TaxID=498761 RepID=B0THH2_HELMI|nr:fad dependent oxidoreductase [Heliomicrobium modesticaldum Ice1]